jgi:hypothetical protein
VFVITGFQELGERRLEALFVAEERDGDLAYAGQVCFGFAGKGLWGELDRLRAGPRARVSCRSNRCCARTSNSSGRRGRFIRDGVLLSLG